jgi:site-specific recombinase XerD
VCQLRWQDCVDRGDTGQVTLLGKGGEIRSVILSSGSWVELRALRGEAGDAAPEFRSKKGGPLDPSTAWRIVKRAAERAGITGPVSPHWFRHAHASHALDRGAPLHEVRTTLGHASLATTSRYIHARPGTSSALYLAV